MQEEGLRRQIMGVITHVLIDEATDTNIRMALLRHLGENPGSPEQALLAHLRGCRGQGTGRAEGPAAAGPS
ncbi:hypothetical protein [Arthrobacter globiformis]|uniref:hypothetical protein n=1 Tax=Arthrobacter globiformis TaxID=1665 RepID=UPI00277DF561|nr:hypothetical protein [Arthrobacter globiformis]MDQ0862866.1 hypothetical protein [Arthrobacter globiformis]